MEKELQKSVIRYIQRFGSDDTQESEIFLSELCDLFNVNVLTIKNDSSPLSKYTLTEIFEAGVKQLCPEALNTEENVKSPTRVKKEFELSDHFKKFLKNVEDKGFFGTHKPGSSEYEERYQKVLSKYEDRFPNTAPSSSDASSENNEVLAEEHKLKGNTLLAAEEFKGAIDEYTKAINAAPTGKNTHIFYCNRAAAYLYLNNNEEAVNDCSMALALNSNYVKAHTRQAQAYLNLNRLSEAHESAETALLLEPNNITAKNIVSQTKTTENKASSTPKGMPDFASLAGGLGGLGGLDFGAMLNNPMVQQMAQQMSQNPDMLSQMMQGMGLGGAGGGGGDMFSKMGEMMNNPQMKQMAETLKGNPNMMDNISNMMKGLNGGNNDDTGVAEAEEDDDEEEVDPKRKGL